MSDLEVSSVPVYDRRRLYFAVGVAYLLFVSGGLVVGWASPSVVKLEDEGQNFTSSQEALLSSIANLAPGSLITIFGMDTIGRKYTLLVAWITIFISPVIMLISREITALLIARFLSGVGLSCSFSIVGVYISELSDVGVRTALNSATYIFLSIGVIISFSVGPFVSFQTYTIVFLVVSSLFGLLWPLLPESPYLEVGKGRLSSARKTIRHLRKGATEEEIDKELEEIKYSIEEERLNKTGFRKLLTSRAVWKQFAISFYVLYLQVGTANDPLTQYSEAVFNAAKLDFNGAYVPIAISLWSILVMLPSPWFFTKFGAKPLLLLGGFGTGIGLIFLGMNFILLKADFDLSPVKYLPIVLTFFIFSCYFIGLGGSVWGIVTSLFAPSVRGAATGICGLLSTFLTFLAIVLFGELKGRLSFGPTLIGFGVIQALASFGVFFLKDTSRMSLVEIQEHFEGLKPPLSISQEILVEQGGGGNSRQEN